MPVVADEQSGYLVSVGQLEAARTPRTKVLLFCSPSNPTGAVYPAEQVEEIGRWALEAGLWVLTDEIYEHLTYGGVTAPSMPVVVPELADRCVVVNGVAKTYAMTGWRVGWMVGPADVVKAATNLQSHATSNVANVSQAAAIAALTGDLSAVATMREAFDRRRQTIVSMLREIPGVACPEPQGAFYVYPSVKGLLGRPIAGRTAETSVELAELILEEAEVAVVPGEAFGTPGYLRMSYALGDDDLVEGVGRMQRLLGSRRVAAAQRGRSSLSSARRRSRTASAAGRSARTAPTSVGRGDASTRWRRRSSGWPRRTPPRRRPPGRPAARRRPCRRRRRSTSPRRRRSRPSSRRRRRAGPGRSASSSAARRVDDLLGAGGEGLVQPRVAELRVADHPVEPHVRDLVHEHLAARAWPRGSSSGTRCRRRSRAAAATVERAVGERARAAASRSAIAATVQSASWSAGSSRAGQHAGGHPDAVRRRPLGRW